MQRRRNRTTQDAIEYHVRRNHAAIFTGTTQHGRIALAQDFVRKAVGERQRATIIELGCGSCDISGPFSSDHHVTRIDCVAEAPSVVADRFGGVQVWVAPVEWLKPQPCDVLVMCEFLEHVAEPVELVKEWLPLARFAVIGHPLVSVPNADPEEGHVFCYSEDDLLNWAILGGHRLVQKKIFPMACYPQMGLILSENTNLL